MKETRVENILMTDMTTVGLMEFVEIDGDFFKTIQNMSIGYEQNDDYYKYKTVGFGSFAKAFGLRRTINQDKSITKFKQE